MSFLEISLQYVPKTGAGALAGLLEDRAGSVTFGKRKVILKTGLALLAGLVIFYIILSGTIVLDNLKRGDLAKEKETAERELASLRSKLLSENSGLTMEFFSGLGYLENKNLEVIKRNNNVAETPTYNLYQ